MFSDERQGPILADYPEHSVNLIEASSLGNPSLDTTIKEYASNGIMIPVVRYPEPTRTIREKNELLSQYSPYIQFILELAAFESGKTPKIAMAKSVTVSLPDGSESIATFLCGLGKDSQLTKSERGQIAVVDGAQGKIRDIERATRTGYAHSAILSDAEMEYGCLNPFTQVEIPRYQIARPLFKERSDTNLDDLAIYVEVATSLDTAIYIPIKHYADFLNKYSENAGISEPVWVSEYTHTVPFYFDSHLPKANRGQKEAYPADLNPNGINYIFGSYSYSDKVA